MPGDVRDADTSTTRITDTALLSITWIETPLIARSGTCAVFASETI